MTFQPHFLRIATLPIGSLLLVVAVAALRPVCANEVKAESDAERYVLEQIQKGDVADFESDVFKKQFPNSKRELRGTFIAALLTPEALLKDLPDEISIAHAVITGELDLTSQEIPNEVSMIDCVFEEKVDLTDSHFAKSLSLSGSRFEESVDFNRVSVGSEFDAEGSEFNSDAAAFVDMQVGRDFKIGALKTTLGTRKTSFASRETSFANVRVGGDFEADNSSFLSERVSFAAMRVDGGFSVQDCTFSNDQKKSVGGSTGPQVSFVAARFGDFFLGGSRFDMNSTIDFRSLQADYISFNDTSFQKSKIDLARMTFKFLSPRDPKKLPFPLSSYDPEFYIDLENSLRTHGYAGEADEVFIAKKRAERRENCKDFLRQCNGGAWAFSLFEDMLAGYGKSLQNLLYWSLGFLIVGMIVFRNEKGMRTKDGKDAENYEGKYNAFWYSLDLFLPIIKLGEADVWTPKHYRRWANLYRKVHIIIGSLFVPIGLAALTGIIK